MNQSFFSVVSMSLILGTSLISCQPSFRTLPQEALNPNGDALEKTSTTDMPVITVTNLAGEPIEQAKVLIGSRLGQPFVNNLLQTNQLGQVTIDSGWDTALPVTVDAPGYMRVTYLNQSPQALLFKLRPLVKTPQIELSGVTTGFGNLKSDNTTDFGLVMHALTRGDLFSFSLDKLISPEMDTISLLGFEASVPSNFTLPQQKESYVIPITLEKERYRLFFRETGLKHIYALRGQFPFKETIDQFRNRGPFSELINSFEFVGGSKREIMMNGPLEVKLPVNEMKFSFKEKIVPPPLEPKTSMISISLFEQNGFFYPTDMHMAENTKSFQLKGLEKENRLFLSAVIHTQNSKAKGKRQEASSIEFVPQKPSHSPQFLDLIPSPVATTTGWTAQPPRQQDRIQVASTYSILSRVLTEGKKRKIFREWEVYAAEWVETMELPEWPEETTQWPDTPSADSDFAQEVVESRRWEIAYIGTFQQLPIPPQALLGPDIATYLTHVSFNSVEY